MVRKAAATRKQQGLASGSTPKGANKATLKRKTDSKDGKDDSPPKKGIGPSVGNHQQKPPSLPPPHHRVGKGLMTGKRPIISDPVRELVTHKDYAIKMVNSIIKETDLDPCGELSSEDLGAFDLFDLSRVCFRRSWYLVYFLRYRSNHWFLFQALVRMKALQDRCVANEGVIRQLRKHQEIQLQEWAQYAEAIRTLNEDHTAKNVMLVEETRQQAEAKKAQVTLATKLVALCERREKAKADTVAEFQTLQPYFDTCGVYYGDGFDDCLNQVRSVYPDLDLSKITIDDTIP